MVGLFPYLKVFSVSSECYNKIPQDSEWLKQQKYVPQSSGSREVRGQGAGRFGVSGENFPRFAAGLIYYCVLTLGLGETSPSLYFFF